MPTPMATVVPDFMFCDAPVPALQLTDDDDIHDVDTLPDAPSRTTGLVGCIPMLFPITVTTTPPEVGMLDPIKLLALNASYVARPDGVVPIRVLLLTTTV